MVIVRRISFQILGVKGSKLVRSWGGGGGDVPRLAEVHFFMKKKFCRTESQHNRLVTVELV